MKRRNFLMSTAAAGAAIAVGPAARAQQRRTLTIMTAGDQNMVDYITDYLGPLFERQNPGVSVRAVGTGPGDAGSQRIWERIEAQRRANAQTVDVDVAVIHQAMAGQMVTQNMLMRYRPEVQTSSLVTNAVARNSLGVNVDGFVMPMFMSQIAIAYNPQTVPNPPRTMDELVTWTQQHPRRFGHNGIRGGMSGVGFVFAWMYAYAPNPQQLINGPYDAGVIASWGPALQRLKEFNRNVTITPGNAGTLDALSRGEIDMGPVWMDMFYTWTSEGRLPPTLRMTLLQSGLPGQPMYYVIPDRSANAELARKFIELATSPQVQAVGIVQRFNWLPGIDAQHVQAHLDRAVWERLFRDIPPDQLAAMGRPMPQADFFRAIQEQYERQVMN